MQNLKVVKFTTKIKINTSQIIKDKIVKGSLRNRYSQSGVIPGVRDEQRTTLARCAWSGSKLGIDLSS